MYIPYYKYNIETKQKCIQKVHLKNMVNKIKFSQEVGSFTSTKNIYSIKMIAQASRQVR